jgi:hypothetical protein
VALLRDEPGTDSTMNRLRAGGRVSSRVAVAVEWKEDGRELRVEGYTVDIGAKGCLVVVPQGFPVGQRLLLVNLVNSSRCEAVLIWRGHEGRKGWELGLELVGPSQSFWGVDS